MPWVVETFGVIGMDGLTLGWMTAILIALFVYFMAGDSIFEIKNWEYEQVAEVTKEAKQKNMKQVSKLIDQAMKDKVIYKNEYKEIMNEYAKAKVLVEMK